MDLLTIEFDPESTEKEASPRELEIFTKLHHMFQPETVVYFATVEQIEQLKTAGVRGVFKRQRK